MTPAIPVPKVAPADLRPAWVFLALMVVTSVGAVYDAVDPNKAALLPLVVAPVVASVLLSTRATAVVSAFCVFLVVVVPQGFVTDQGVQLIRFSALVALGVLAILSAIWRQRLADTRVRLAVTNAQAVDARRRAVELNDGVYQNLFAARMWSEMGDVEAAGTSIENALSATSSLLNELLEQGHVAPGSFVNHVIDLRGEADDDPH